MYLQQISHMVSISNFRYKRPSHAKSFVQMQADTFVLNGTQFLSNAMQT